MTDAAPQPDVSALIPDPSAVQDRLAASIRETTILRRLFRLSLDARDNSKRGGRGDAPVKEAAHA
ncbi:MAG: hypothetical protein U0746_11775 [Gemmataceae bacterium]